MLPVLFRIVIKQHEGKVEQTLSASPVSGRMDTNTLFFFFSFFFFFGACPSAIKIDRSQGEKGGQEETRCLIDLMSTDGEEIYIVNSPLPVWPHQTQTVVHGVMSIPTYRIDFY